MEELDAGGVPGTGDGSGAGSAVVVGSALFVAGAALEDGGLISSDTSESAIVSV